MRVANRTAIRAKQATYLDGPFKTSYNPSASSNIPACPTVIKDHLRAGNHMHGNSVFVTHCNEISVELAFEAESHRVGCHGFKLDCSLNSFYDHRRDELFDEYGEVEVDVVMDSVEMRLPVITMLVRVEVAAPEVQELEDGPEAHLLEEVEDMLPSRSLGESTSELFQFRLVE